MHDPGLPAEQPLEPYRRRGPAEERLVEVQLGLHDGSREEAGGLGPDRVVAGRDDQHGQPVHDEAARPGLGADAGEGAEAGQPPQDGGPVGGAGGGQGEQRDAEVGADDGAALADHGAEDHADRARAGLTDRGRAERVLGHWAPHPGGAAVMVVPAGGAERG